MYFSFYPKNKAFYRAKGFILQLDFSIFNVKTSFKIDYTIKEVAAVNKHIDQLCRKTMSTFDISKGGFQHMESTNKARTYKADKTSN